MINNQITLYKTADWKKYISDFDQILLHLPK